MRYMITFVLAFALTACCATPIVPDWLGQGQCMPPITEASDCPGYRHFTDEASGLDYCCPEECIGWICGQERTGGPYCACPTNEPDVNDGLWCCHPEMTEEQCDAFPGHFLDGCCWKDV